MFPVGQARIRLSLSANGSLNLAQRAETKNFLRVNICRAAEGGAPIDPIGWGYGVSKSRCGTVSSGCRLVRDRIV